MHRRSLNPRNAQHLKQQAAADDISNGVQRADLVETDLLDRNPWTAASASPSSR
jgi:hypothetical protein